MKTADELRIQDVPDLRTELLFDIVVNLAPKQNFGNGPRGLRIYFGSAGGTFRGPQLRGEVLPGGGDWALFTPEGTMALDVRLSLKTDDDALIHMTYGGRWAVPEALREAMRDEHQRYGVDPSRYYFRTTPLFETGSLRYAWLNEVVCIGSGYLVQGGVAYRVSRVL
jgi:hypothetical protein